MLGRPNPPTSKKVNDIIFTVGGLIFFAGLLPAASDTDTRIPLRTSLPTALVLAVYALTFGLSLDLPFSAASSALTASVWLFLAIYRRT